MSRKGRGFKLAFNTITCTRCSADRIRGIVCPDCGLAPAEWEVDHRLLQRRNVIRGLDEILNREPEATDSAPVLTDHQLLLDECDAVVTNLIAALQEATSSTGTGEALRETVTNFVELRGLVRHAQRLRPYLAVAALATTMMVELEQVIRHYLDALSTARPIDAQRHASEAQKHIDRATDAAGAFARYHGDLEQIDYETTGSMIGSMIAIKMRHSGETFVDLIKHAEAEVAALLDVEDASAVAFQFTLCEFVMALEFDPERFRRTFVAAHKHFVNARGLISKLAAEGPELVDDFLDSQIAIFNSCWNIRAITEHAQTTRQAAQAVLDLYVTMFEGPAAVISRVLLLTAGLTQKPYRALRQGNATTDVREARAEPQVTQLLEGLDDQLRIAQSHQLVRYTDHSITATTHRSQFEIEYDDLLDLVFKALESVLACMTALRQAFAGAGVEIDDTALAPEIGLPILDLARLSLEQLSGHAVDVQLTDDDELHIEIDGDLEMSMSAHVAGISRAFDDKNFRFSNASNAGKRVLTGNTGSFNTPNAEDEFGQQFRWISICTDLQLNGGPAITAAQLRKWSASMALQRIVEAGQGLAQPATVARKLNMMIGLAQKTEDPELEDVLRRCKRWLRLQDNTDQLIDDLTPWIKNSVDWDAP